MAHPMLKDARSGHTDKLRKMTEDYGAAGGPSMNKAAPVNRPKGDIGDDEEIGFGVEGGAAKPRADRASRRPSIANPVATYKRGGAVRKADGGDVSSIEAANRDQAMSKPADRARGGRTKHGKGTHVNVIVAPQGGGAGAGAGAPPPVLPMPPPMAGGPPGMPPGMPPKPLMGAAPPPGLPMAPGAPGGMPPGIMPPRARGGRVHADEAQDKDLIQRTLKNEGLIRSDKEEPVGVGRAKGGRINSIHDMTAGSLSGEGRLQKAELQSKHRPKPQAV